MEFLQNKSIVNICLSLYCLEEEDNGDTYVMIGAAQNREKNSEQNPFFGLLSVAWVTKPEPLPRLLLYNRSCLSECHKNYHFKARGEKFIHENCTAPLHSTWRPSWPGPSDAKTF